MLFLIFLFLTFRLSGSEKAAFLLISMSFSLCDRVIAEHTPPGLKNRADTDMTNTAILKPAA